MSLRSAGGGSSSATFERGVGRRPDSGRRRRKSSWVGAFFRAWTAFLAGIGLAVADEPSVPIDFARQVRPILAEHCWRCHGPDRATREAGLRLDRREAAIALGAIVPGDREAGTLIDRIESDDADYRMPPADAEGPLDESQKQVLRDWIAQGAEFSEHWAFRAPRRPEAPPVLVSGWARNPIDRFVLHRLEREGLAPAPEADRATLLRRVTLDLTGLPPTLEELDLHLADTAPGAYERAVDRLLASPRHAERMAMAWLDAARYADTNGFNNDEERTMWPWRDWVINAFRQNQPYDQFLLEQLAGDLLPEPTRAQRVATGFHRNQVHNTEGGIIAEEYRVEYVADRVHTTATVFLGLSLQCARCHDHKYDPITQREYYRFFAYFNGLDERQGGYKGSSVVEPFVRLPSPEQAAELRELEARRLDLERRIASRVGAADEGLARWERESPREVLAGLAQRRLLVHVPFDEGAGETTEDVGHPEQPGRLRGQPQWATGRTSGAIELSDGAHVDLGDRADTDGPSPFSVGVWVNPANAQGMAVLSKMDEADGHRGYDIVLDGGKVVCHLIHRWPDDALKVVTKEALRPKTWRHVLVTYDGSRSVSGLKIYIDGKPSPLDVSGGPLKGTIATEGPFHLGTRPGSPPFRGMLDDLQWFGEELSAADATVLATGQALVPARGLLEAPAERRTPLQRAQLRRFFLDRIDPEYAWLQAERADVTRRRAELEKSLPAAMVMRDLAEPRATFVLKRGQYDQPGEPVTPGVPAMLPPLPSDAPPNRLGLARWLVDPAHPLTARVAVNRWWAMSFGAGLVRTLEDFGTMGEPPSHPELLDYLASELVRTGWDVRAVQRLIVTSSTYRQSSKVTPDLLKRDPENRLLARGPRHRLSAEVIRDNALAISGLLSQRIGGPSVKPYQPAGLWEDVSVERRATYVADHGDGLYRRGMYTFWKRTCPPPGLMSFDAPNREVCVARRARTNTPLQALVLLNDPTFLEAARKLAERVSAVEATPEGRLRLAFRLAAARPPRAEEHSILMDIYREAVGRYQADRQAAAALLAVGESPRGVMFDTAELAAGTVMCSTILNLDEVISKR